MSNIRNRMTRHGSVYLTGNIMQRAVSFIMLPIYTRYLTPADYGVLELLSMVIDFVAIIFGMRVGAAIFRYYARYENAKDRNEVISTSLFLVLLMTLAGMLLIWATAGPLSQLVFGHTDHKFLLVLFSVTLVTQSLIAVPMTFLKARERSLTFLGVSMLKLTMQLGLNIYFVVFLGMRVEGVIYASLITGTLISSGLSLYTLSLTGARYSLAKAKEIIGFSVPLMGAAVLAFYFTFGDRYFLRIYGGTDEVGIYSLAYRFGFLLSFLVGSPFGSIWDAEKFHVAKKENAVSIYQNVFLVFSTLILFCAVGLSIFVDEFLMIMSAESFWPAARIVPVVVAAYVFQLWTSYGNLGIHLKGQTLKITYANLLSVLIITPGYFVLIPLYGAMGAALATLGTFAVRCWYINRSASKLFNMHLPWHRILNAGVLSVAAVSVSFLGPQSLVAGLAFDVVIMLVFTGLFFLAPILPVEMRSEFFRLLFSPRLIVLYFK